MQVRRPVIVIGKDADPKSAVALGEVFYGRPNIDINPVLLQPKSSCFNEFAAADLQEILVLGHGSKNTYGGVAPKQFVKLFSDDFKKAFRDEGAKKQVRDLYLVGCNIGFIDRKGNSVAQTIVNDLYKCGFVNVRLHCVSYCATKADVNKELIIQVMIAPGAAGFAENVAQLARQTGKIVASPGYVKSYLEDQHKVVTPLHEGAHPKTELEKEYNIFLHNETLDQRNARVEKSFQDQKRFTRQNVIMILQMQWNYLRSPKKNTAVDKAKALFLKKYIADLAVANDENWKNILHRLAVSANKLFNNSSTTLKLINHIHAEDMNAIEDIKQARVEGYAEPQMASALVIQPESDTEDFIMIGSQTQLEIIADLQNDITAAIKTIEAEIKPLQESIFSQSPYHQSQLELKNAKLEVLKSLRNAGFDIKKIHEIAVNAASNEIVTKGRESRTSLLLNNIIEITGRQMSKANKP